MKSLFVGSFNPITKAHENIASDLLINKIVDYVYFLPVNSSKSDLISISERIKLIKLIINNNEEVLNIYDFNKDGLFYYDVLKKISDKYNIKYLIMGSDLFYHFNTFKNYKNILNEYYLIIINRDNKIKKYLEDNYSLYKDKIILINNKYDGSSKLAKEHLDDNDSYLNKKVLAYIKEKNIYK